MHLVKRGEIFIKSFNSINNSIDCINIQEEEINKDVLNVLSDKTSNGNERPWKDKKLKSLELSNSYKRLDIVSKQLRVHQCGNFLEFRKYTDGTKKLFGSNFCKVRLCSMCGWRRELKIFHQVSKVINYLKQENDYKFLFLTLTCKNVHGEDLSQQLDLMFKAYKRLFERKDVVKPIKGWFRALEVTHDVHRTITKEKYKEKKNYYNNLNLKAGDINPNFDMYHPHFHVILMVNKSYFSDKNYYITQKKWTSLWQESLRVDYTPIVDVRSFKVNNSKSVSEVAKYTVKDKDYLIKGDDDLTDKTVLTLDTALASRRLVAFGKAMRDAHKKLNLTDVEDDKDLVHISDDEFCDEVNFVIERYKWNIGYSNYLKF